MLVYAAREDSEFHIPCQQRIAEAGTGPTAVFLTWNICYEFLRLITHARIYPQPWSLQEGCQFPTTLLAAPRFGVLLPTPNHLYALNQLATEFPNIRGNPVHDLHTVVLMREHGIRQICTLDSDFRRFPFLEVVSPLA